MNERTERAQLNLQQGTYSASGEGLDYAFYDSQRIDVAILQHRFFVNPVGQPMTDGTIKNLSHTNMISAGMPQGSKMVARSIGLIYVSEGLTNNAGFQAIVDLLANTVMSVKIPGKDTILQLTLLHMLGWNMSQILVPTVAGDQINTNVLSTVNKEYKLNVPIVLAAQTQFEIFVEHTAAPAAALDGDQLRLFIRGKLKRLS